MKAEIFTLAEYANADPNGGKMTIVGTFDHVGGIQLPIVIPQCAIAIRLRFGIVENGPKKVRLSFVDDDGTAIVPTIEMPLIVQVPQGELTTTVPCVAIMQQLKLPRFGEYSIGLAIDTNEVASIPLIARQIHLPQQPQIRPPETPQA